MPTRTAHAQDKARVRFYGVLSEEEQTRRGQAIADTMALQIDEEQPDRGIDSSAVLQVAPALVRDFVAAAARQPERVHAVDLAAIGIVGSRGGDSPAPRHRDCQHFGAFDDAAVGQYRWQSV